VTRAAKFRTDPKFFGRPPAQIAVPFGACSDPTLKRNDLRVLCFLILLARKKNWCRVSQTKMAAAVCVDRATIARSINRLVRAGYVIRKNRTKIGGRISWHPFSAHTYRLSWKVDRP